MYRLLLAYAYHNENLILAYKYASFSNIEFPYLAIGMAFSLKPRRHVAHKAFHFRPYVDRENDEAF